METNYDVCIDKDNTKWKKKKLNPNYALNIIRSQLKLTSDINFISQDGYPIDLEDEEKIFLSEILFKKDKSYCLYLKTNKADWISINIYLNNDKIYSGNYPKSIKLKDLIKDYNHLLPRNAILLSKGYPVDLEEYEESEANELLEDNNLYYKSEENNNVINNEKNKKIEEEDYYNKTEKNISEKKEPEEIILIKIGNDTKIKKLRLSTKLNELREELKKELLFRFKFLAKTISVEENDEDKWTINDILITEDNSKIINIKNCEIENRVIEEIKNIKFYDGNKLLLRQKLDINQTLENVREIISEKIQKDFKFMRKKKEVDEDDESELSLKDIIKDDIVKIKSINNVMEKNNETFIKFKLNGKELFANKINHSLTLFELRKAFKIIPENAKFLKDEYEVTNERSTIVEDILKDREFILLKDEEDHPPPEEVKKEMKKYKIYLNDKFLYFYQFKENITLDDIRKILSTSISNKEQFISYEDEEIPLDTEDQWTLKDYCNEDTKVFIKTIKIPEPEKPKVQLNEPIKGSIELGQENNLLIYQYPNKPFDDNEKNLSKTIMVVGETGSGKTTLLNSFLNFLMGIKYEDNFRYKIIVENMNNKNPGGSVTDEVNIYYIRTSIEDMKYIRIVDTPGFGDTRGIEYDKKIIDMIRETFTKKCDTINAICFVAKSNETRLTDFQKYIFAQVMALFGKDVGENFIAMLTFCDGQVPNIIESLKSSESIFSQIRDQIQDPWYLTFNNSAIFNGIEQKFTKNFWDLGIDSYISFARKLKMLPEKSLTLSKKVLELRKQLEATIIGLRPQIERSLGIMENIRKEIAYIKSHKDKIDQYKDFNYKYKEPKVTKKNLEQGHYTSNCLICNYTCHYPCYIPDDNQKMNCSAMRNGKCTVCKNKCMWNEHKNLNFIFVYEEVEKTKTSEDLRKKYVESTSNLKHSEQILKGLEKDFINILTECYKNTESIKDCVEKLKENSLCKNPNESFEEYIKSCILNEEREKKPGYADRIKGYQILKDTNDKIIKAFKGQSLFEDLDKFKDYIKKEKEEIMKMFEKEDKKGNECMIF